MDVQADVPVLRRYASPLGAMVLAADAQGLCGAWFADAPAARIPDGASLSGDSPVLRAAMQWLDAYFAGQQPAPLPPLHLRGTAFQKLVWAALLEIPCGQTVSYGTLAQQLAAYRNVRRLSAQAVGGAVGRNPILLFVPCHRVLGAGGALTGYSGGLARKQWLLQHEAAPQK